MFGGHSSKDTQAMSSSAPKLARHLGFAGVLPFYLGAIALWAADESAQDAALAVTMIYAATILSFVGAVHWGRALAEPVGDASWGWSVVPALLGWLAAAWLDALPGLILLIVGFWAAYVVDARAAREGRFPFWYIVLRKHLSALVVLALGLCIVAVAT
jgi:cadmium resistance protein CadD (predicted permease)